MTDKLEPDIEMMLAASALTGFCESALDFGLRTDGTCVMTDEWRDRLGDYVAKTRAAINEFLIARQHQ